MKTMFGCAVASVAGSMLVLGLCSRAAIYWEPVSWKTHPPLELPLFDHGRKCGREFAIAVSLDRRHEWVFECGKVRDEDLEGQLARDAAIWKGLGYRPALRVRIAGHEPARHFLRLHRAATAAGIEDFSFAGYPGER